MVMVTMEASDGQTMAGAGVRLLYIGTMEDFMEAGNFMKAADCMAVMQINIRTKKPGYMSGFFIFVKRLILLSLVLSPYLYLCQGPL